jgi:hypothetical protein
MLFPPHTWFRDQSQKPNRMLRDFQVRLVLSFIRGVAMTDMPDATTIVSQIAGWRGLPPGAFDFI